MCVCVRQGGLDRSQRMRNSQEQQLQGMSDYPLEQDQGYITMDKFANSEFGEARNHIANGRGAGQVTYLG